MKLKLLIFILFLATLANCFAGEALTQRINRYAGKNANELSTYIDSLSGLKAYYTNYLFDHMSDNDLAVVTPDYIDEHITYALKTLDLPYTSNIPEDYFLHYILPLRISQEPFENWRKDFYDDLYPQISLVKSINEAILIADLYYQEGIYFKQTSGRDQGPITSIKRGYGRCEEMMILQMAVLRSAGIPCRPASAPYWSFTDSNHVWTEVWTPEGWRIVPEAYPLKYRKSSWEVDRAMKAPLITSQTFGSYQATNTLKTTNFDTKVNITDVYGPIESTSVKVVNEDNKAVANADVVYYASSFGGLFAMLEMQSDENGQVLVDFRPTSLFVTAGKDGKTGYGVINSFTGNNNLVITLSDNSLVDENIVLNFPLDSSSNRDFALTPDNKNYLDKITDLANKKRDNRLLNNKKGLSFLTNYPLPERSETEETYIEKRTEYLDKCQELAGNADNWLYIDKWIEQSDNPDLMRKIMIDLVIAWNIKDLIELPDTTAIKNLLTTHTRNRIFYQDTYDYDLFKSNVLNLPWGSNPFPQTGWQTDLAVITKKLQEKSIDHTVKNIYAWLKENTIVDQHANWSYFGGSLTPLQYVNKKYLSENQQFYLFSALLQNTGIPLRWKGFLEYFNGDSWQEIVWKDSNEDNDYPPTDRQLVEFKLTLTSDGKTLDTEPFSNFLIASMTDNGKLTNTWFDLETNDDDEALVKFYQEADQQNYIQGYVRNKNGDANLIIKAIDVNTKEVTLNFVTPKTTNENKIDWSDDTIEAIENLITQNNFIENKVLVFLLNKNGNEPQERMLEQVVNKLDDFANKDVHVIVYSESRDIPQLVSTNQANLTYIKGEKLIYENINLDNYPLIFLYDAGDLVTSANGFDLGMINYLLRLVD